MQSALLDRLLQERSAKNPVVLVTRLASGEQVLIDETGVPLVGGLALDETQTQAALKALKDDKSGVEEASGLFFQVHNPPLRMLIIGAVHIAQALIPMAQVLGYEVVLIDPRRAWASEARFPDVTVTYDWPDDAMRALAPDSRTAVVALTHDPKLDDPALAIALESPAFYIGALGSKRTHAKRQVRLKEAGVSDAAFARIDGPIGIPLGGRSPAEIALSILAKVTQVRYAAPDAA